MFEAINVLLHRNNELRFVQPLDVDFLIGESVKLFQQQSGSEQASKDFSNLSARLVRGSTGYMIRAIINHLFNANIQQVDVNPEEIKDACKIS